MKLKTAFAATLFFVLSSAMIFAQAPNENITDSTDQQQNMMQPQNQNNGNDFGFGGFDMGMPNSSFADPEYVAQQTMIESMTTAYNWIALNSTKFAEGCRADKTALTTQIASVVQQAQETSIVCQKLSEEANACNPEIFCSRFSSGQLPLPPEATAAMKKAGYDTKTLKVNDITQEMIEQVCQSQTNPENTQRQQMLESVKTKIRDQLPKFRSQCEEFKKNTQAGPDIRLPDLGNMPTVQRTYAPGTGSGQQGGQCQEPHPDCAPNGAPFCQNGNWVCPTGGPNGPIQQQPMQPGPEQQAPQQGNIVCPGQAPDCAPNGAPYCENGNWICPAAPSAPQAPQIVQEPQQPVTEPTPQQEPTPTPEPTPAPEPAPTVSTAAQPFLVNISRFITGLVTGVAVNSVCGNKICEPDFGENSGNCQQDCMTGQQQGKVQTMAPGPSPQALCEMTDEEIIDSYTQGMNSGPTQQQTEYNCKMQSSRMLQEMNRYKLEIARCNADAALDCEAKKQAFASCNEMKDNPEKIGQMIVENMCRRFGTTTTEQAKNKLYDVANKWYNSDPALANQLGDTADKTIVDQKNLNVISYFFGDGNYASKLKERTAKLRAIRERLVSKNAADSETLSDLDSQINDLETEANKFGNFFDVTRIGYMFR